MKKTVLLILLLCMLPIQLAYGSGAQPAPDIDFNSDSQLDVMYDIPATGEYEGYRKLMGFKLAEYYDAYFTYKVDGSIFSSHYVIVPLKTLDQDELITMTFPDGETQTATRDTWYKIFRSFRSSLLSDYFNRHYSDIYSEWAIYDSGIPLESLVDRYITKTYSPKIEKSYPLLLPNTKIYQNYDTYASQYMSLFCLKAGFYDTDAEKHIPGIEFELKNDGNKYLKEVQVTVYFKDKSGVTIRTEIITPISEQYASGDNTAKLLQPDSIWYMQKDEFYKFKPLPPEWDPEATVAKVTAITVAE